MVDFLKTSDTGIFNDGKGVVRFAWNGVEVSGPEFLDKVDSLKLQLEAYKVLARAVDVYICNGSSEELGEIEKALAAIPGSMDA